MRTFSYWEKEFLVDSFDYAIIGGGLVGLNAAIFLKKKYPKAKVAVFERGVFPSGASSRNAGFACFGSPGELVDDLQNISSDEVWKTVEKRFKGLELLKKELGEKNIGFQKTGGYELYSQKTQNQTEKVCSKIEYLNQNMAKIIGVENLYKQVDIPNNLRNFSLALYNSEEGLINSGLLMNTLLKMAQAQDVQYFSGFGLSLFEEKNDSIELSFQFDEVFKVATRNLIFCTNAFSSYFIDEIDIVPGRGMVLVTEKLKKLPPVAAYHHNCGYDYFRVIDGRILIGGGRDLDKTTEQSLQFESNPIIKQYLLDFLSQHFEANNFKIEYEWQGFMAFGENKNPVVKRINDRIYIAARLGGMGVAIGTQTALDLVGLISD